MVLCVCVCVCACVCACVCVCKIRVRVKVRVVDKVELRRHKLLMTPVRAHASYWGGLRFG